jgi:hypothetical protein
MAGTIRREYEFLEDSWASLNDVTEKPDRIQHKLQGFGEGRFQRVL